MGLRIHNPYGEIDMSLFIQPSGRSGQRSGD